MRVFYTRILFGVRTLRPVKPPLGEPCEPRRKDDRDEHRPNGQTGILTTRHFNSPPVPHNLGFRLAPPSTNCPHALQEPRQRCLVRHCTRQVTDLRSHYICEAAPPNRRAREFHCTYRPFCTLWDPKARRQALQLPERYPA